MLQRMYSKKHGIISCWWCYCSVAKFCPTLCDSRDCSMPSSSVFHCCCCCKSLQSCPTLCNPIDGSTMLPRPWDSPGKNIGVGCHFCLQCMKVKSESEVTQLCPTLSDLMDCSLPGSSVHGIFQARVLEWGAIAFSYLLEFAQIHVH